ncbi:hypothetical protein RIR_jg32344.t2 [Rhizophagus irregularis DAOM 181602=DAOM 197198]|nr:hypothetical protein RIR_jg32344.t2 [Rhizophagus irregularis DAOM 181602=DAOM 197198]
MKVPQVRQVYYNIFVESALSNTSEKAKDPKDRRFALLAYFKTYCKAACVFLVLGGGAGLIVVTKESKQWQSNATVDDEQIDHHYRLKDPINSLMIMLRSIENFINCPVFIKSGSFSELLVLSSEVFRNRTIFGKSFISRYAYCPPRRMYTEMTGILARSAFLLHQIILKHT